MIAFVSHPFRAMLHPVPKAAACLNYEVVRQATQLSHIKIWIDKWPATRSFGDAAVIRRTQAGMISANLPCYLCFSWSAS